MNFTLKRAIFSKHMAMLARNMLDRQTFIQAIFTNIYKFVKYKIIKLYFAYPKTFWLIIIYRISLNETKRVL